jgi:arylsulfatase A-like enzyme
MWAHSCGMNGLVHRGFRMNDCDQHMVRYFKHNGYETVLCGIQHEAENGAEIGYDLSYVEAVDWKSEPDYRRKDKERAVKAAEYLLQPKNKPFFMSVGLFSTHRPYTETDPDIHPDFVNPPFPMYDSPEARQDMAAYLTSARIADHSFGIVMEALHQSGHDQDTIVIFTTDHGLAFPKMKCWLYDTGIGVSLIIKLPRHSNPGKSLDALVSQIDLFPTLCDWAGLEKPDWLQGESLMPLLAGETSVVREQLFAEVNYHTHYLPIRCVRTERYKYIKYYMNPQYNIEYGIDDSISRQFVYDHGLLDQSLDSEMLFDLYTDPMERNNLCGKQEHEAVRRDMSERLHNWMMQTEDPLLNGVVPAPEGADIQYLD